MNKAALVISNDLSIELLKQQNEDCIDLLLFLSCLPGGLYLQQLKDIWEDNVHSYIHFLEDLALIEDQSETENDYGHRYVLTQFTQKYIQ